MEEDRCASFLDAAEASSAAACVDVWAGSVEEMEVEALFEGVVGVGVPVVLGDSRLECDDWEPYVILDAVFALDDVG
jgi:hypothetical protein